MPRKNSSTRAVNDTVTAARLEDINQDIDDLYSEWPDRLRVRKAISWTPLRIDISAGAYYIWSSQGVYWWWTDIVVTNNATNYVMIDNAWTITISTSARTAWLWRLAQVICSGGAVTSIILRNNMVFGGAALDINALPEDTAPDEDNDFFITYDASAWSNKKVKPKNINLWQFNIFTAGETIVAGECIRQWILWIDATITQAAQTSYSYLAYDTFTSRGQGQSFTITGLTRIHNIKVYLRKLGSPTWNIQCRVYSWIGTTLVATSTNTISAAALTGAATEQTFTFTPFDTNTGTYTFVISKDGTTSWSNYIGIDTNGSSVYAWWSQYTVTQAMVRWAVASQDVKFIITMYTSPEDPTRVYRASATSTVYNKFIGFSENAAAAWVAVRVSHLVNPNQAWLSIWTLYYLSNTPGAISVSPGTVSTLVWKALTANSLAISF